ncbi:MAG TPA: hypothetical protein ENJ99_01295 [Rhizobiales bacterium]|nr:hypothetical protein [Hyphomicrobiales bacterium]
MHKLSKALILLPLVTMSIAAASNGPASAEVRYVGPAGAVKLLAQSKAVNAKCNHLSASESSELSGYTAKAEIAVARMQGAGTARDARHAGIKQGKAMACGRGSEELVRASLDAARRAMAQAKGQRPRTASLQPRQQQKPAPRPVIRRSLPPASEPVVRIYRPEGARENKSLTRYRRITTAYYLERRCQHLPPAKAMAFWKRIVASHKSVLKKYTSSQVARTMASARAAARARGACGNSTRRIVMAGYRSTGL